MIPLRDVIPSRTTPYVTMALIALNLLVFVREITLPADATERFFLAYGLIPAQFSWVSLLTSMFVHAGWLHIGSNMLSLWIFGDNVEDRMGHGRFLIFYLLAGTAAALLETQANTASWLPLVGASGAIAGVMGAYLFMFPHSRIHVLIMLIFYIDIVEIPAVMFLGIWFVMQILGGVGRVASEVGTGGIAFWAHVGGFVTGAVASFLFKRPERTQADWWSDKEGQR
jgi:membrane associated rhomboid family serine protease